MVHTLQPIALGLIITWPTLSFVAVVLRLWSRWLMRKFFWDDILIIVAWLSALGECICVYNYTLLTYQGYHYYDIPDIPIAQQIEGNKFNIANQAFYIPVLGLVKASVIIFLWRLDDPRQGIRLSLASLFVFNICLTVATWFTCLFQCSPVNYFWDSPIMDTIVDGKTVRKGGTCIDQIAFYLTQSSLAVLTDIFILLIPAVMIWNLRMQIRKKIAVWAILSLGWIVTVVGIVRIVLYYYRFKPDNIDRSYSVTFTLTGMEVNLAIVAACGPALKALFTRYVPRLLSSRNASIPRGNVTYWPRGYDPSNRRGRSGFSDRMRSWHSKPADRPRDMQYGMEILQSIERENNDGQYNSTIPNESVTTKKSFDFGFSSQKIEKIARPEMTARSAGQAG